MDMKYSTGALVALPEDFSFHLEPSGLWRVETVSDEEFITVYMEETSSRSLLRVEPSVQYSAEFYAKLDAAWEIFKNRPEYQLGIIDFTDMDSMRISYENQLMAVAFIRATRGGKEVDDAKILKQIMRCINWLRTTDMYVAPASSAYHESCPGGLVEHSLKVVRSIIQLCKAEPFCSLVNLEDAVLVALVHDWCKIGLYEKFMRNVKNDETGQWEQVPSYRYKSERMSAFGHGASSMYLAQKFFNLNMVEALAVRWHMGEYNVAQLEMNELHQANELYPLVYLLQFADRVACTKYGGVR